MRIAVFATGGTFDKEYNELNGSLYFKQTHIPEMLELGRSRVPVRIQTLMMKTCPGASARHLRCYEWALLSVELGYQESGHWSH